MSTTDASIRYVATDDNKENVADERNAEVERELGEIKERLRLTESQLLEERNARNRLTQQVRKRHSS